MVFCVFIYSSNQCMNEFEFFVGFFCVISLVCIQNTLMATNFKILKYITKIFKVSILCIFNARQGTIPKNSVENLDSMN